MARPKADLDHLTVPKEGQDAPATTPGSPSKGYAHTLSLRLTTEQYRRLRRFVAGEEDRTGQRLTHQAIIEAALADYLQRRGG
jgi:hypothetical protein